MLLRVIIKNPVRTTTPDQDHHRSLANAISANVYNCGVWYHTMDDYDQKQCQTY